MSSDCLLQPTVEAVHRCEKVEKRIGAGFSTMPYVHTEKPAGGVRGRLDGLVARCIHQYDSPARSPNLGAVLRDLVHGAASVNYSGYS